MALTEQSTSCGRRNVGSDENAIGTVPYDTQSTTYSIFEFILPNFKLTVFLYYVLISKIIVEMQ